MFEPLKKNKCRRLCPEVKKIAAGATTFYLVWQGCVGSLMAQVDIAEGNWAGDLLKESPQ